MDQLGQPNDNHVLREAGQVSARLFLFSHLDILQLLGHSSTQVSSPDDVADAGEDRRVRRGRRGWEEAAPKAPGRNSLGFVASTGQRTRPHEVCLSPV